MTPEQQLDFGKALIDRIRDIPLNQGIEPQIVEALIEIGSPVPEHEDFTMALGIVLDIHSLRVRAHADAMNKRVKSPLEQANRDPASLIRDIIAAKAKAAHPSLPFQSIQPSAIARDTMEIQPLPEGATRPLYTKEPDLEWVEDKLAQIQTNLAALRESIENRELPPNLGLNIIKLINEADQDEPKGKTLLEVFADEEDELDPEGTVEAPPNSE